MEIMDIKGQYVNADKMKPIIPWSGYSNKNILLSEGLSSGGGNSQAVVYK